MSHERDIGSSAEAAHLPDDLEDEEPRSNTQTRRLLLELQVHQVELELQNEELRLSRAAVEEGLARFTELYDFAPVGYFTFLPDGTIREVNLPGARLLRTERAHILERPMTSFLAPERRGVFLAWLEGIFSETAANSHITTLLGKEPKARAVEIEATVSTSGDVARAIVVDITERLKIEEQLRQSQKIDTIGQLAGGVAHDFNNILGAMMLNLDRLEGEPGVPESCGPPLSDLRSLAKRASNLTRQLLQFSRRQTVEQGQIELNETLRQLHEMLQRVLGEQLVYSWREVEGSLLVSGDVAQLEQVVVNLCLNARDAMAGAGTLTLGTSRVEFDGTSDPENPHGRIGEFACVSVGDSGSGMTHEVARQVFEPFFTTKEVGKGTGLGLSSSLGVIQRHDGWITLESQVGQGTCFRFYLPLMEGSAACLSTIPPPGDDGPSGVTILLVEDEKALLAVCTRSLEALGYEVLSAPDGPSALAIWGERASTIDLLLTDMRMPGGMTGLQLAKTLWEEAPLLKVVIMSGYSSEMLHEGPSGAAGFTFLQKPFDLKELGKAVRRALGQLARASAQ